MSLHSISKSKIKTLFSLQPLARANHQLWCSSRVHAIPAFKVLQHLRFCNTHCWGRNLWIKNQGWNQAAWTNSNL